MSLILHDKRCCPVKVINAGKSTPCFVLLMRRLLLSHSYSMDQRTHNKITLQVDLSLGFSGFGSPFGVQPPDVMPEACEQQRHVRSGRGGSEADAQ